ncbi:MAG: S-layer homology domain-containing protein [Oscillospiraceae bacterium]|nr:S-layer homology domain-containing protein [Oscillospiraceae bacterium]
MKKTKRRNNILALLLAMLLALSPVTMVAAVQEPQVISATTAQTLDELMQNPMGNITRAQFAMLLNAVLSLPEGLGADYYDVPEDHPYAADIGTAQMIGYMVGDGKGYFRPDAVITGAEATMCINFFLGFDMAQLSKLDLQVVVPNWGRAAATNILDLGMVSRELIEKRTLTVLDALEFAGALMVAIMFPGSPYALTQARENDDFYAFNNRSYLATATLEPGYPYAMSFLDPSIVVEQQIGELLAGILAEGGEVGSDAWNIAEIYAMYLDEPARVASLEKVLPIIDEIRAVESIEQLNTLAAKYFYLMNIQGFYVIGTINDAKTDATKWCMILAPGSLMLGSRDYYADVPELEPIHNVLKAFIVSVLEYIGEIEDLESRAQAVFDIEQSNALASMPIEFYTPDTIFTKSSWSELDAITTGSDTLNYSQELRDILKDVNVYCPDIEYIKHVEALYIEDNLEVLKDFAMINAISTFATVIGDDFISLSADLRTAMYGTDTERSSIERRAQNLIMRLMSSSFSRLYAETYVSAETKADVTEIIELVRDKYRQRIAELEWMSEATKAKAIEKLNSITAYVAYPDEYGEQYSFNVTARADGGNLVDFVIDIAEVAYEQQLEMMKRPFDINFWDQVPTYTVNAYYSPTENAIMIPAGILQAPFYSKDASRESNLGGIGAVIAHEFTHAFDNSGAKYDIHGTITDWWTAEDYEAFGALTDNVAAVLSEIAFVGDLYVNGVLCTGEAIADLGAVACVLDIADDSEDANLADLMHAWSGIWAARMPVEMAAYLLAVDSHLPNKLRVNFILAQLDDFYETFQVLESDAMYIAPGERISIW